MRIKFSREIQRENAMLKTKQQHWNLKYVYAFYLLHLKICRLFVSFLSLSLSDSSSAEVVIKILFSCFSSFHWIKFMFNFCVAKYFFALNRRKRDNSIKRSNNSTQNQRSKEKNTLKKKRYEKRSQRLARWNAPLWFHRWSHIANNAAHQDT